MPRYGFAFSGAFLTGLALLFIDGIPDPMARYFVPSLVVYSLGAAYIDTVHRIVGIASTQKWVLRRKRPANAVQLKYAIPLALRGLLLAIQSTWFAAFVAYQFWRSVP